MRRIVAVELLSADGYFSAEDANDFEWFTAFPEFAAFNAKEAQRFDTLMYGRTSYEGFLGYWPAALNNPNLSKDEKTLARKMNSMQRVVFSRTLPPSADNGTTVFAEIRPGDIKKMKARPGKDIVIYGSGSIVRRLTELGLIDEYVLALVPTFLGRGRSFLSGIRPRVKLELLETRRFRSGTMMLRYRPS